MIAEFEFSRPQLKYESGNGHSGRDAIIHYSVASNWKTVFFTNSSV